MFEPPNLHGLPLVVTFVRGSGGTEAWWVVPRAPLLSFAKKLEEVDPRRYVRWREQMLTKTYPRKNAMSDIGAYLAAFADLGPPGPLNAHYAAQRCDDHWALVSVSVEPSHKDGSNVYTLNHEVWLAHDSTGALLVRHLAYRRTALPLPRALRKNRIADYSRFEPLAREAATPPTPADLPPSTRAPTYRAMMCADRPLRLARFSKQLLARISPAMKITRFAVPTAPLSDTDGDCAAAVIDIGIEGGDSQMRTHVDDWLRLQDGVERIDVLENGAGTNDVRRIRVAFR